MAGRHISVFVSYRFRLLGTYLIGMQGNFFGKVSENGRERNHGDEIKPKFGRITPLQRIG